MNRANEKSLELSTEITADDKKFFIHTEKKGDNSSEITSRVYLKGRILISKDVGFTHLVGLDNFQAKLNNLMEKNHKLVVEQLNQMLEKSQKKSSEYLNEANSLIHKCQYKEAFQLLKKGLEVYPDNVLLLSCYGAIYSKVENKYREGVRICRDAILRMDSNVSINREFLYPILYLNLGKAYLCANKKIEAIKAFTIGLKSDPTNLYIKTELDNLGKRRKPIIPFLERGNTLNKYLGLFLYKTGLLRR